MLKFLAVSAAVVAVAALVRFSWRRHTDSLAARAHIERADSLIAGARFDDAVRELRAALAIRSNDAAAMRRVGLLYARLGENTQAQYYLSLALSRNPRDAELRERLAAVYAASGNLDAAREQSASPPKPDSVSEDVDPRATLLDLIRRALADRQFDSAAARATRVLGRWPSDVEALVLRADALFAKSDTAGAARDLRQALSADPTLPGARVRLAEVQLREGAAAEARAGLEAAAADAGTAYAEPLLALSDLDMRSGAPERAIASLERLVAAHPQSRRSYERLGFAQLSAGDAKSALASFEHAVALDSSNARGHYAVGLALLAQQKRAEARRAFNASLALAPDFLDPTVKLVEMDLADKRPRDAVARLQSALTRAPRSAALYGLLGNAYQSAGDATAAESALRRAIELDPGNEETRLRLATMQGATGRNDAAMASLGTVLQSNPRSARALMLSGVAFEERGDFPRARAAYEQALTVDSSMAAAANNLAMLLMKHGKPADRAKALHLAEVAYRAAPGDPNVADTFGWILYQAVLADPIRPRQTLTAAIQLLQQSAKEMPDNGEVQYHLGLALRLRGDTAGSRAALEAALRSPGLAALRDSAKLALGALEQRR